MMLGGDVDYISCMSVSPGPVLNNSPILNITRSLQSLHRKYVLLWDSYPCAVSFSS